MKRFPALRGDVSFAAALSAWRCYPTARALRRLGGACGVAQTIPESKVDVSSAAARLADATVATHFANWLDNGPSLRQRHFAGCGLRGRRGRRCRCSILYRLRDTGHTPG